MCFFPLKPFDERKTKDLSAAAIAGALNKKFGAIQDAVIFAVPPPPVQGFGNTGGFKLFLQDRAAHGYDELARVTAEVLNNARQQHELNPYATYTTFQNSVPQLYADVDRVKAKRQGVPLSSVFDTLQAYLGSVYVNDFNRFGRTYRVYAQAEPQFRSQPEDIANSEDAQLERRHGADGCGRRRAVRIRARIACRTTTSISRPTSTARALPGISSEPGNRRHGTACCTRPCRTASATSGPILTFQQKTRRQYRALFVFPICVMLVFLILSAQYESWALPLAVILIVPMCLLSRDGGRVAQGLGQQCADPDRLHRAGRARVQERHPDRRVRARARRVTDWRRSTRRSRRAGCVCGPSS